MRIWIAVIEVVAIGLLLGWGSDAITLDGERTVYTLKCADGQWQAESCGGHVLAGDRFRFRALRAHAEVVFWTVGASGPSGKFSDCKISDGRNWACPAQAQTVQTITLEMRKGLPMPSSSGQTKAFHAVSKWRWHLARLGMPIGNSADN